MQFNSINFLIFFPIVVLIYILIPKKIRYVWLLAASYYFYMSWNAKYAILIAISTLITYLSGLLLDGFEKHRKMVVALSFVTNLGILLFFKYFDFALDNVNVLLRHFNMSVVQKPFDIVLPVGISFYTFQALSYTVDVYRGNIKAEKNILKYALFVSFFPQLVAGPIERSANLLKQIQEIPQRKLLNYKRMTDGLVVMLWGLFLKMVIADRIDVVVNTVFEKYFYYGTVELIVGAIAFAIQIYCDFSSYSIIAIGAAEVMGFSLMENFNVPYFSKSIKEFWRRWHISLSTWFRDYLYIPLGGSRCSKTRKYFNIMVTFLASGLWHGANWTYVLWGGLHGLYQIIGDITRPFKDKINAKLHTKTDTIGYRLGQALITFLLVDFAWIFFRASSIMDAFGYIKRIFIRPNFWTLFDGSLYNLGLDRFESNVLFVSIMILLLVECIRYYKNMRIDAFLDSQCIWFKWMCLISLITTIVVYGQYGPGYDLSQFIYFQF